MTATAQAPVKANAPFAPPPVEVGQTVLWRHSPSDENPVAAIVTSSNGRVLEVWVLSIGRFNGQPRDGVYHIDDPDLRRRETTEGCWDLLDRDKKINKLIDELVKK